jgi:hypothetical protein
MAFAKRLSPISYQERKMIRMAVSQFTMIKKHCVVSNEWIAKRLKMGHLVCKSMAKRFFRKSEQGRKLIARYEKILISKD